MSIPILRKGTSIMELRNERILMRHLRAVKLTFGTVTAVVLNSLLHSRPLEMGQHPLVRFLCTKMSLE